MRPEGLETIYLMYEIDRRELPARILLASKLMESNYRVVIFQHNQLRNICLFQKPGVLYIKSNPYSIDNLLFIAKYRGFTIVCSQEEGVHFNGELESWGSKKVLTFSTKSAKLIDLYFAWNQLDATTAQIHGVPENKIKIVGNIRLQLPQKFIAKKNNFDMKKLKILLVSYFSGDIINSAYKKRISASKEPAYDKIYSDYVYYFTQNMQIFKDTENLFIDLIKLSVNYDFELNFRRYYDDQSSLEDYTQENFKLDSNLYVAKSINEADVVVHYGSSVAIEAICGDRLPILLSANLDEKDSKIQALGPKFSNSQELLDWLKLNSKESLEKELIHSKTRLKEIYGIDPSTDSITEISINIHKLINNFKATELSKSEELSIQKVYVQEIKIILRDMLVKIFQRVKSGKLILGSSSSKAPNLTYPRIFELFSALDLNFAPAQVNFKISKNKKTVVFNLKSFKENDFH